MKFIVGEKLEMSQIFDEEGRCYTVTKVKVGSGIITQIKTKGKEGYDAIQIGFGEKRENLLSKALVGHFKKLGNFRYIKETRLQKDDIDQYKVGDVVESTVFAEGDIVNVAGISKGKGFQGVVKRHGFHGGPRSHGQKHSEREPGSIGATGPQRVFKGKRMGGRMGSDRVTVKNLKIMKVNEKENEILLSGAVPGKRGTLIEITGIGK